MSRLWRCDSKAVLLELCYFFVGVICVLDEDMPLLLLVAEDISLVLFARAVDLAEDASSDLSRQAVQ